MALRPKRANSFRSFANSNAPKLVIEYRPLSCFWIKVPFILTNLSPKKILESHRMKRGCAANLNYDTAFFVNLPSHASEDALQGFNLIVPKVLRLLHLVGLGEVGHR